MASNKESNTTMGKVKESFNHSYKISLDMNFEASAKIFKGLCGIQRNCLVLASVLGSCFRILLTICTATPKAN